MKNEIKTFLLKSEKHKREFDSFLTKIRSLDGGNDVYHDLLEYFEAYINLYDYLFDFLKD